MSTTPSFKGGNAIFARTSSIKERGAGGGGYGGPRMERTHALYGRMKEERRPVFVLSARLHSLIRE